MTDLLRSVGIIIGGTVVGVVPVVIWIAIQDRRNVPCACPCHQVVQPGLVPCPRCEREES